MFVQMRIPRTGAIKMGLSPQGEGEVLEARLSVVEFAGRLTLATGRVIPPGAVKVYLVGVRRARLAMDCILRQHDRANLVLGIAMESCRRRMWTPDEVDDVLAWLSCVLLAHFVNLRSEVASDEETVAWAQSVTVDELVDLCESNFAAAYGMWAQRETDEAESSSSHRQPD